VLKVQELFRVLETFLPKELIIFPQKGVKVHKQEVCYIFIANS